MLQSASLKIELVDVLPGEYKRRAQHDFIFSHRNRAQSPGTERLIIADPLGRGLVDHEIPRVALSISIPRDDPNAFGSRFTQHRRDARLIFDSRMIVQSCKNSAYGMLTGTKEANMNL